jgi:hypothetical protein
MKVSKLQQAIFTPLTALSLTWLPIGYIKINLLKHPVPSLFFWSSADTLPHNNTKPHLKKREFADTSIAAQTEP